MNCVQKYPSSDVPKVFSTENAYNAISLSVKGEYDSLIRPIT